MSVVGVLDAQTLSFTSSAGVKLSHSHLERSLDVPRQEISIACGNFKDGFKAADITGSFCHQSSFLANSDHKEYADVHVTTRKTCDADGEY